MKFKIRTTLKSNPKPHDDSFADRHLVENKNSFTSTPYYYENGWSINIKNLDDLISIAEKNNSIYLIMGKNEQHPQIIIKEQEII